MRKCLTHLLNEKILLVIFQVENSRYNIPEIEIIQFLVEFYDGMGSWTDLIVEEL